MWDLSKIMILKVWSKGGTIKTVSSDVKQQEGEQVTFCRRASHVGILIQELGRTEIGKKAENRSDIKIWNKKCLFRSFTW